MGYYYNSISLWYIISFIPLLNSSTNSLSLYLLSLTILLNFWTNSSIVFPYCSNLFTSAIFIVFSSPLPNSFLRSAKNSPAVLYSSNFSSKSSSIFSFYTSADLSYTYNKIYYIYSSTVIFLIFILIYNLHAITKSNTFLELPLNICGLATSSILDAASPLYAANKA